MLHNPADMSDEDIVRMALSEQAFFGHIVMRYEEKLARYIRRLGIHNSEDNEDVLQDIFIKVYKNLNAFDTGLPFSSWIYRIAHNEAISFYRKKHVRPEGHLINEGDELLLREVAKQDDAEVLFDRGLNADLVQNALYTIDRKYRDVLILRFFEHKDYEEISDILKIPVGTVGTLIYRGKDILKKEIDSEHIRV